jgi:hypothetical protein
MADRADSAMFSVNTRPDRSGQAGRRSTRQGPGSGGAGVWALPDGLRLGVTVTRPPAFVLVWPDVVYERRH